MGIEKHAKRLDSLFKAAGIDQSRLRVRYTPFMGDLGDAQVDGALQSVINHRHFTWAYMIINLLHFFKNKIRAKPPTEAAQSGMMVFKLNTERYVIILSKAADASTAVEKLTKDEAGIRQMSNAWIRKNIDSVDLEGPDKRFILEHLDDPEKVKRIHAQTDADGTTYHVIDAVMKDGTIDPEDACVSHTTWEP